MKFAKTKLALGILFLVCSILSTVIQLAPKASAAGASFVTGNGNIDTAISEKLNTRFVFLDPFHIKDTVSGMTYTTSATTCDMFTCNGGSLYNAHWYWYWPNDTGASMTTPVTGNCVSALVLGISTNGDAIAGGQVAIVNPEKDARGGSCFVDEAKDAWDCSNGPCTDNEDRKHAPNSDIEGAGAHAHVDVGSLDGQIGDNNNYTVNPDEVAIKSLAQNNSSDINMFKGLGTMLWWNSPTLMTSYIGGTTLQKVDAAGQPSLIQDISSGLKKGTGSSYVTGYDYYYSDSCFDTQSQKLKAIVAVSTGSDHSLVTVLHRQNGDVSKGFDDSWYGSQISCMNSNQNIKTSPANFWKSAGSGRIGIADVANYLNPNSVSGGGSGAGSNTQATDCGTSASGDAQACTDATLDCQGGSLNWLICPVITAMQGAAEKLDGFIMNTLDIDVKPIFDQKTAASKGYYQAWNSFRILGTAVLIIGGLIMIASQAFGLEILDAYTIRKVLPRLLVAVIGISLSWPLMRLAVDFFDVLGFDIRSLMYAPFSHLGGNISISTGILTTLGATAVIFATGLASLTFIGTALLAVLVGFVILVIREIALVMLIIVAPFAIACYILPNTQKLWKLWSENFLGLMLMFPIISALIAAGHIFAAITVRGGSNDTGGLIAQAIGILAYFLPYFLLPLAARLATGVIGNLAGVVNDRGKGAFDRLKKYRGNAAAKNFEKMKAGQRFSERNALTRGFNRTSAGVGSGWNGRFGFGERGANAIGQARHNAAVNGVMKSPGWAAIQENDDALRAATYNSAGAARQALLARGWKADRVDRAVSAAQTAIGFGRPQAIAAAQQLATTGTGYEDMEDQARTIARAAGGDKSVAASIAGYNNFINKQKGRYDLAPGAGKLIGLAHGEIDAAEGGAGPTHDQYHEASVAGLRGADPVTMLRGKKPQVENLMNTLVEHATTQQALSVDTTISQEERDAANEEFIRTMGHLDQISQSKSYASPENQAVVDGAMNATAGLRGQLGDIMGTNQPTGWQGPLTPEQQRNRDLYNQSRAPRLNANDPNLPQP